MSTISDMSDLSKQGSGQYAEEFRGLSLQGAILSMSLFFVEYISKGTFGNCHPHVHIAIKVEKSRCRPLLNLIQH